jgi:hydrogenase maturation protein HypF
MKVNLRDFDRLAHLRKVPMPGSSMAIKEPWRMAMVYLSTVFGEEATSLKIDLVKRIDLHQWDILQRAIERKINTPWTSSMGRLFDAIASLLSIRDEVHYEGQAAIELEMIAAPEVKGQYPFQIHREERPMVIDLRETVRGVVHDLTENIRASEISGKFHRTVASLIINTCEIIRTRECLNRVVLSGGVFQNLFLLSLVKEGLKESGFEIYTHHLVPPNDGGIALGQAVIAHMKLFQT